MVRPTFALLFAVGLGCTGTIESTEVAGLTPLQQIALTDWINVAEPAFDTNTCATCHDGSNAEYPNAPPYLMGKTDVDRRNQVLAITPPVVNLQNPQSSRVLVKQIHEGPALDATGVTAILQWIEAEKAARPAPDLPITSPYTMMDCVVGSAGGSDCPINSIDLTPAGAAGTITFTESALDGGTYLQSLTITAGASGLHVVHPQFGSVTGTGSGSGTANDTFDDQDRFFNIDMEIPASGTLSLGSPTFDNIVPSDPLVVEFDTLTAMDGSD